MINHLLKPINFSVTGLKCDVEGCDFKDMSIPTSDYKKWINVPCPNCGGNLLTLKDYNLTRTMKIIVNIANVVYLPIHLVRYLLSSKYRERSKLQWIQHLEMNGTGNVKLGTFEIKENN